MSSRRANVVRRSVAAKHGHWLKYDSAGTIPRQAGEANTNYLDVLTSLSSAVTDEFGGVITNWPSPFFWLNSHSLKLHFDQIFPIFVKL